MSCVMRSRSKMLLEVQESLLQFLYLIEVKLLHLCIFFHDRLLLFFFLSWFCRSFLRVLLDEFLNTSRRINDFLLAREKRMTLGTQVDTDFFNRRSCFNFIATCTCNNTRDILRVNFLPHHVPPYSTPLIESRKSLFVFVLPIFSVRNSICSITFISDKSLRRIHSRFNSDSVRISSSFRVPDFSDVCEVSLPPLEPHTEAALGIPIFRLRVYFPRPKGVEEDPFLSSKSWSAIQGNRP